MIDDARIRELAEEVLRELRAPSSEAPARADLEARVSALESEVTRLRAQRALPLAEGTPVVHVHVERPSGHEHPAHEHVSHRGLGPAAGEGRCVVEPDRPCVRSGQCRSFGY